MRPHRLAATVLALGCLGAAILLQVARDRRYPRQVAGVKAVIYVQSGEAIRRLALSFDALAADLYWIRAIQHYGGDRRDLAKQHKYDRLYPLLDLTTSLDPYFTIAYRFGAIFLSEKYPGGAGRPDQAIALLQKGIAAQPAKWQYYHDVGFVHYWQRDDKRSAAEWFRRGAALPGAPNWLEPVAASMLIEGGDRGSARVILRQLLGSEEAWLRRMATRSLMQLDALDEIDRLAVLAQRYPPPPGQPYAWNWLGQIGVLTRTPTDPSGFPFDLDSATGAVTVSADSELSPMPGVPR